MRVFPYYGCKRSLALLIAFPWVIERFGGRKNVFKVF
jgi:hypothetical protein